MQEVDLSRMSPGSFERLIRAIAFSKIGIGGMVFSPGADGGRDFVFDGKIGGYQSKNWDGYLTIQAKYRVKLEGGSNDIAWLKRQLDAEIKNLKANSAVKKPKYYIIATNISLSGADNGRDGETSRRGGITKIEEILGQWKSEIGLVDFDIWHSDKIADLLADLPSIRKAYAAWITPGDVLSEMLRTVSFENNNFANLIKRSIKNLTRRDQFAKLKDAGNVIDAQVRTSQVFIDLPIESITYGKESTSFLTHRSRIEDSSQNRVVANIVKRAKECLSVGERLDIIGQEELVDPRNVRNKIVIVGGPGQGKSTLSGFVSQLFRASLLSSEASYIYDENVKLLVPEILERARKEGISDQLPRRYPALVSLPRYADSISAAREQKQQLPSILTQIATDLSRACDDTIGRNDIRSWLSEYPWIVILDGLDEVPPSGERVPVIDAIESFMTEIADADADCLVIITTRPQGYNHDLSPQSWEHWRLADLSSERALVYAEALGRARYPDDPDRRDDVLKLLSDAAAKSTTARLMISPLQVTIMYLIVDTGGSVPAARWTLFNEYFEVLRKRERAKGGETQKVLERNWNFLGPIHQRAGLILQTDSEHGGGAGSSLNHKRFKEVLENYLRAEGYEDEEIADRVTELMDVALNRLVLLSTQEEGSITFDVRSLQEFMAASAITSTDAKPMTDRLLYISGMSHWRHVFLIAASRCFSDDAFWERREAIAGLPRLMETNEADISIRSGARLALEMFVDGIGADHPVTRKQLAQHALELLVWMPHGVASDLWRVYEPITSKNVELVLLDHISNYSSPGFALAWQVLLKLARYHPHLESLAEASWPSEANALKKILSNLDLPLPTERLSQAVKTALLSEPPFDENGRNIADFRVEGIENNDYDELTKQLLTLDLSFQRRPLRDRSANIGLLDPSEDSPIVIRLVTVGQELEETLQELLPIISDVPDWSSVAIVHEFESDPTHDNLSRCLLKLADSNNLHQAKHLSTMLCSWPLYTVLVQCSTNQDLLRFAKLAGDGELGRLEDWKCAERRWEEYGLTAEDLKFASDGLYFGSNVRNIGAPSLYVKRFTPSEVASELLGQLSQIAFQSSNQVLAIELADIVGWTAGVHSSGAVSFSQKTADAILKAIPLCEYKRACMDIFDLFDLQFFDDEDMRRQLAAVTYYCDCTETKGDLIKLSDYIRFFQRYPDTREILIVIACWTVSATEFDKERLSDLPKDAFKIFAADSPEISAAVAVLMLATQSHDNIDVQKIAAIFAELDDSSVIGEMIDALLSGERLDPNLRANILASILRVRALSGRKNRDYLKELLKRALDARPSRFNEKSVWIDRFKFPSDAYTSVQTEMNHTYEFR